MKFREMIPVIEAIQCLRKGFPLSAIEVKAGAWAIQLIPCENGSYTYELRKATGGVWRVSDITEVESILFK